LPDLKDLYQCISLFLRSTLWNEQLQCTISFMYGFGPRGGIDNTNPSSRISP
jgi:hypothetical protein